MNVVGTSYKLLTRYFRFSSIMGKRKSNSENTAVKGKKIKDLPSDVYDQQRIAVCASVADFKFNKKRVRMISDVNEVPESFEAVLYWMFRDQRVQDNWAMLYAQKLALKFEKPLYVCVCLPSKYMLATYRQYYFMLEGLKEVEQQLRELHIPFTVLNGSPPEVLIDFILSKNVGVVVADFLPLRLPMQWLDDVKKSLPTNVSLCQVDAHNVVPCWYASNKQEYSARTIRPKITNKLPEFLTQFPPVIPHPHKSDKSMLKAVDWECVYNFIEVDRSVSPPEWAKPGTSAGYAKLEEFVGSRLKNFESGRNDPTKIAVSDLSPWLHAGQISAQRVALTVRESRGRYSDSVSAFLEESIVRRELTDNFCYYNEKYDSVQGAADWAQKTLKEHARDKREKLYTREQFEQGRTHDPLWNAAQYQLLSEGKMHGFLRMYWAKKILEWSKSPEEALEISLYLNDKYELDGIDPNGYVGCMWSICGIHDQGWAERPVFGKIRYMNYKGCERKFDVKAFISKYDRSAKKLK